MKINVIHQVHFSEKVNIKQVKYIKESLYKLRDSGEISFTDIWLGKQFSPAAKDGRYGGIIENKAEHEGEICLIISFKDESEVIDYLENKKHADLRKELYSSFSPKIGNLYEEATRLSILGEDVSKLFKEIESLAKPFFRRRQYVRYSEDC